MPALVSLATELFDVLRADPAYTPAVDWLRKYLPPEKYEELDTLGVVAPAPVGSERQVFTRGSTQRTLIVRVGLVSKVSQLDDAAIDGRITLIETIIERAEQNDTPTYGTPDAVAINQLWDEDGIKAGVFQSLIDFTYTTFE